MGQGDGVMIGAAAQERHAQMVAVRQLKSHHLGPELDGLFQIAHLIDQVADFVDRDGRWISARCFDRSIGARLLVHACLHANSPALII